MRPDPLSSPRDRALDRALNGPAESEPALRNAAANDSGLPAELQTLVEKIHRHAYKVTDAEMAALQAKYGDDRLFEIVVCASLGASRRRLFAGLAALEEA
ncbi:MAG: hypothetical protein HOQ12_06175 [Gemmatimonadaceae bacterium]|nr:hypothetical protein [Gemmatimonadaceae bacterium]